MCIPNCVVLVCTCVVVFLALNVYCVFVLLVLLDFPVFVQVYVQKGCVFVIEKESWLCSLDF